MWRFARGWVGGWKPFGCAQGTRTPLLYAFSLEVAGFCLTLICCASGLARFSSALSPLESVLTRSALMLTRSALMLTLFSLAVPGFAIGAGWLCLGACTLCIVAGGAFSSRHGLFKNADDTKAEEPGPIARLDSSVESKRGEIHSFRFHSRMARGIHSGIHEEASHR